MSADIRAKIAEIAASQIGAHEAPAHDNTGSQILKYQQATGLDGSGWPWCAAFVDWVIWQWMRQYPEASAIAIGDRPRTAGAFALRHWGERNRCIITREDPAPGDIVVYSFSHCGIVESYGGDILFTAIEGNTNRDGSRDGYEVARRIRNLRSVLSFVRLPLAI